MTAAWASVLFLTAGFAAEAFETDFTGRPVAIAVGAPSALFALTTTLGLVVATAGGRTLATRVPRLRAGAAAGIAVLAGGMVAVGAVVVLGVVVG
ncbi:hypothetical protein [Actinotalea fermentans]|nr:hypothetical protein [Actinotalea fermentans]